MSYRGDEDLQALLLGADVLGRVDHGPRGAAAVQLGNKRSTTSASLAFISLTQIYWWQYRLRVNTVAIQT